MKIGLIGKGRMAKAIHQIVKTTNHSIVAEFDEDNPVNLHQVTDCDILIDFSHADGIANHLDMALEAKIPLVSGTTGWYDRIDEFRAKVEKADGTFLYASNFSIGVLLFHKLLERAGQLYGTFNQYDFSVHEIHHNQKVDSPSGTAITLANTVLKQVDNKDHLCLGNPDGQIDSQALQVSSSRLGQIPGTHSLLIDSAADTIEITHRAKGREGFASGSIKAAEWLINKKGFYSIEDMINAVLKSD